MTKKSYIVPPEVFEKYTPEQKMNTLFYYISALHDNAEIQNEVTCAEIRKLKNQKWVNKGVAAGAGGVGSLILRVGEFLLSKI